MSKLERKSFKIFGETASEENIGQFGSAIAGTKLNTSDVEKIQELDAWSKGWESATIGENRYPAMQERTGVDKVFSYQIAYMLQQGIPEWGETTNYAIGSVVKIIKDGVVSLYTSLTNNNIGNAVTNATHWQIMGQANIDLSNLSEVGEKHFLGKSQITNCITGIPQRIKADVVDGTLTVYAGTVCIVPYGTTDRTSEFPIGSTFIHENFKVVDTQFEDDKFFVWVEVQNDIADNPQISDTITRLVEIDLTNNKYLAVTSTLSGTTQYSGAANNMTYRTDLNIMQYTGSGTLTNYVATLPILITPADGTYVHGSITQTFNGIGYIGSTYWVDKGYKGLIANKRNADGTCKNIEWTNETLKTYTYASTLNGARYPAFSYTGNKLDYMILDDNNWTFDTEKNIYVYRGVELLWLDLGTCTVTNGVISNFNPKQPFRAVDYSEYSNNIDGKWVTVNKTIFSNKTFDVGTYTTHDCKDILPNDGNVYECIFRCYWGNGGKVAGAYLRSIDMNMDFTLGKGLWWNDTSRQVVLKSGGTYRFGNLQSSEVSITGCSLILTGYRKVR